MAIENFIVESTVGGAKGVNTPSSTYGIDPPSAVASEPQQSPGAVMVNVNSRAVFGRGRGPGFTRALGLFFALAFGTIGCSPSPPPPPGPPRVWDVAPGDLCRTASAYQGHRVRVRLPAGGYSVWPHGISLNPPRGRDVALVFECHTPPADNSRDLVLTGVVAPVTPDGVWRLNGVDWETRVRDTAVVYPRP